MEIVVTGCTGKLGAAVVRLWQEEHEVQALGRSEANLLEPAQLRSKLEGRSFDALVNCAAMANVDQCDEEPEAARLVNSDSPGELAAICAERGARFLHLSTDYVLDGTEEGLKDENAEAAPISTYGRTKWEGEQRVQEAYPSAVVGRVCWIFGTQPGAFVEGFLRRARAGEPLEAISDKVSKPTFVDDLAQMMMAVVEFRDASGLFHLCHKGEPESWWSWGTKALQLAKEEGLIDEVPEVARKRMADLPQLAASRPFHTAMEPRRLKDELQWEGRTWVDAVRGKMSNLLESS